MKAKPKSVRTMFIEKKRNRMLKRNQNLLVCVVGGTGSGKTYGAITLADELMNGNMNPERHIVFDIEHFMDLINNGHIKKGEVVIFEEAGVNISSKDWGTKANKNINKVLQTCRHLNFGVIFTLPSFKFMDNSSRMLQHSVFVADETNINYTTNQSKFKVYDLINNPMKSIEPMTIFPKFYYENQLVQMKYIYVKKPREELLEVYEKRKTEFTTKLNKQVQSEIVQERLDSEAKVKFSAFCKKCGARNSFDFSKKRMEWTCRRCGGIVKSNPFKKNE